MILSMDHHHGTHHASINDRKRTSDIFGVIKGLDFGEETDIGEVHEDPLVYLSMLS